MRKEKGNNQKEGSDMKKTIIAILMVVMVATPCFAQEVETDGLFSIDGTLWEADIERYPEVIEKVEFLQFGFFQGKVYFKNRNACSFFSSSS